VSEPLRPQRSRWWRRTVAVVVLTAACSGLAACGGDGSDGGDVPTGPVSFEFTGDAATIDGAAIPASVLSDTLAVFRSSPAAVQLAFREDSLNQAGSDQPKASIVANILTTEISTAVIDAEINRRGLAPSDDVKAIAEAQMAGTFGDALDQQPAYRQTLIDRYARFVTLDQALAPPPDEAALRAEYARDPSAWEEACARHILVAEAAEAERLLAQLRAGADFAQLAKDNSTDPGSGAAGGDLGCQVRGMYVPEFERAVWDGELNVVQGPVRTEFGYHLIEVTSRGARAFEDVRGAIIEKLGPAPFNALGDWLRQALQSAPITVDDRFGTWDAPSGTVTPKGVATDGLELAPDSSASSTSGR
jgi:parvulin-like peptidyl-prolyl isomerase